MDSAVAASFMEGCDSCSYLLVSPFAERSIVHSEDSLEYKVACLVKNWEKVSAFVCCFQLRTMSVLFFL